MPTHGLTPPAGSLDHEVVDWRQVRRARFELRQRFTYEYPTAIANLRQRLIVLPNPSHGDQRLLHDRLEVASLAYERQESLDTFGNRVVRLEVPRIERRIDFTVSLQLERVAGGPLPDAPSEDAKTFLEPTLLTAPDLSLRRAARRLARDAAGDEHTLVRAVTEWVHGAVRYARGVTHVRTTAAGAFAQRAGVCQDFTHIALVLLRLSGIPARYVSGHLLGEGGTHAWVEALLPHPERRNALVAYGFDPTHGRETGLNYITIAAGRDYLDVAPTTGSYTGSAQGTLSTSKRAELVELEYDDGTCWSDAREGAA